jgi:hypothetical protein
MLFVDIVCCCKARCGVKNKINVWIDSLPEDKRLYLVLVIVGAAIGCISFGPIWLGSLGLAILCGAMLLVTRSI